MMSAPQRTREAAIVAPAATMYANSLYQVIKLHVPGIRADHLVIATDDGELVVSADGEHCHYLRRLPLRYHARREHIEVTLTGDALEIRIPNPEAPRI
jgi:HSP20 family molecular chaperone IbpA